METENEDVCRFCLKALGNENYEIIENLKLGMLDVLLLKLNFTVSIAPLVCTRCVESLKKAFYFKTACLSMEQRVNQYVSDSRKLKVNLKDVYLAQKEIKNGRKVIRDDHKVCRFCLRLFRDSALKDIGGDTSLTGVLQKYFPELDLNVTKEICVCGGCLEGLTNNFNFIMNCLDTEKHIKKYCEIECITGNVQINLRNVSQFVEILRSIHKNAAYHTEPEQSEKTRSEENSTDETLEDNDSVMSTDEETVEENDLPSPCHTPKSSEKESSINSFTNESPSCFTRSKTRYPRDPSQMYKCIHCPFETVYRGSLSKHMLQHQDFSKVTTFKCDQCTFETRHRSSYNRHLLSVHSTNKTSYECEQCSFQATGKWALKLHKNMHEKGDQFPVHKCGECHYEAATKKGLKSHMKSHVQERKAVTHSCKRCDFKTASKDELTAHDLTHKNGKGVGFKCDVCQFTTKHKGNLKTHSLTHKSSSETIMYKCSQCTFETKHKISLKTHMLKHKSPSEVAMFGCEFCGFKSKHKGNLKLHMVIHKDPTETTMYKCEKCDFQTKHKMSLRTHMLRHKKRSEVVRHKCEVCDYWTLQKGNLKKHELIHKTASEVTWYCCRLCSFETIHKGSFKMHSSNFHPQLPGCEAIIEEGKETYKIKEG